VSAIDRSPPAEPSREPRIEIVHESLLTKWPRLERWRTQDAEETRARDGRANTPLASSRRPK